MLNLEQAIKLVMAERRCSRAEALLLLEQFKRERPDAWSPLEQQADKMEAELKNK